MRFDNRPPAWCLAEAGLIMIMASVLIRLLPFRWLARTIGANRDGAIPMSAPAVALLRRSIRAWSRRLPWRTMCFEEGLTAHWMLRRRGLASTLFYGAASIDGRLKAHVWVRSGTLDVVGCETASDYVELARFPG